MTAGEPNLPCANATRIDASLWQWDTRGQVKPYGSRTWRAADDDETPWNGHGRQARTLRRCRRHLNTIDTLEQDRWNRQPLLGSRGAAIILISSLLLLAHTIPVAAHLCVVGASILSAIWAHSTTGKRHRHTTAARQFRRFLTDPEARPVAISACEEHELSFAVGDDEHGEAELLRYLRTAHDAMTWQTHTNIDNYSTALRQHGWNLALAREIAHCQDVNGHTLVTLARLDQPATADRFDAIREVWKGIHNWDAGTQQLAHQMAEHWHGNSHTLLETVHAVREQTTAEERKEASTLSSAQKGTR